MDNQNEILEQPIKKKRGRKPKKKEDKIYFGEKEEQAVVDYIKSNSKSEKNRIFLNILEPAFKKLIESIIRTYKLYVPGETFEDTYYDTLSEVSRIIEKFNIDSGKRAYSYYGNCIKHYVTNRRKKKMIQDQETPSYDSIDENITNTLSFTDKTDIDRSIAQDEIKMLLSKIKNMTDNPQQYCLKGNELKLGIGLLNLLENWDLVISSDGSNKLNKSAVLLYLREQTGLDSKSIRSNLKKFRKEFLIIKDFVVKQY